MTTKKSSKNDISSWSLTARVLVLSLLIGGVSGVCAGAVTSKWISDYSSELARFSTPISVDDPLPINLPQSYAEAVTKIRTNVPPAVVSVFKVKNKDFTRDIIAPEKQLSSGLVVTSDGWLLSYVPDFKAEQTAELQVRVADKIYGVSNALATPESGWWFLKADNASNLPVLPFGEGLSMLSGDQIILVSSINSLEPSHVVSRIDVSTTSSSDKIETRFVIEPAGLIVPGAIAVNTYGDVVGFLSQTENGSRNIIPVEVFLSAIRSILRTGSVHVAGLGLFGDNISLFPSNAPGLPSGITRGFLITEIKTTQSSFGFELGDVILSVNGEWVDDRHALSDYIGSHSVGDTLLITVFRSGKEETLSVTLPEGL